MGKYKSERAIYTVNLFKMDVLFTILQNGNLIIRRSAIACTF